MLTFLCAVYCMYDVLNGYPALVSCFSQCGDVAFIDTVHNAHVRVASECSHAWWAARRSVVAVCLLSCSCIDYI